MTTEQQRKMLECAAKACGLSEVERTPYGFFRCVGVHEDGKRCLVEWNPLANPADCAEMCAKLEINHEHHSDYIQCLWAPQETYHVITMLKDHDNSRLKAWMYAATMVAAKIGGYEE